MLESLIQLSWMGLKMTISRGDLFLANLDPTIGKEIQKTRPVVIVSNDVNNAHSDLVTIVPITSQKLSKIYPFEVLLPDSTKGLDKSSKAKANQIRTIDKQRLSKKLGSLDPQTLLLLGKAIKIHLDL